jgi:hypothetical protein
MKFRSPVYKKAGDLFWTKCNLDEEIFIYNGEYVWNLIVAV